MYMKTDCTSKQVNLPYTPTVHIPYTYSTPSLNIDFIWSQLCQLDLLGIKLCQVDFLGIKLFAPHLDPICTKCEGPMYFFSINTITNE